MAAEATPDTDGYAHKYWAVTNHHRSNNPNPKHVPADTAVGLSPAAPNQWPAKRAPPANKPLTPSLIRMVSCSFSASSDMVALVLVFAGGLGSNYDEQASEK